MNILDHLNQKKYIDIMSRFTLIKKIIVIESH